MQLQMAVSALLFTGLFAIPVQAIEEDESKKRRATAKIEQGKASVSAPQQSVAVSREADEKSDCESVPANLYKNLDMNSF